MFCYPIAPEPLAGCPHAAKLKNIGPYFQPKLCAVLGFRMLARPAVLLRIEGGVLFAVTILGYRESHASWILFAALLLAPDLSLAGYAAGVKIGAAVYNLVHTLAGPLVLLGLGIVRGALFAAALRTGVGSTWSPRK